MKKVLFLTTAHRDDDDRIFHHQAKSFVGKGYHAKVCSLSSGRKGGYEGVEVESYPILEADISQKLRVLEKIIEGSTPDIIFCSEPLAVVSTRKYRKQKKVPVVYDITEWYPSMRMVAGHSFFKQMLLAVKFFIIQLYAGYLSTAFVFGEKTKYFPLYYLFWWKKSIVLPYYPSSEYVEDGRKPLEEGKITLAYTGNFSEGKGVGRFLRVVEQVQRLRPAVRVKALLIGKSFTEKDQKYFEAELAKYSFLEIEVRPSLPLKSFCVAIKEADICFDLRDINFENHHCLPIKIFYYAASGKPVVYPRLKAIRQEVEISQFGYLVNPEDIGGIAQIVLRYMDSPSLYQHHALAARRLYECEYCWENIFVRLQTFTEQLLLETR